MSVCWLQTPDVPWIFITGCWVCRLMIVGRTSVTWLQVGAVQIHLLELPGAGQSRDPGLHGGRDQHLAMNVTSLDELVQTLETAGIAYTRSRSGRKALFCRDPDGNALELVETV
jgi:hypothetical protein